MILKWLTVMVLIVMGLANLWLAGDMTYKSGKTIWLWHSSKNWPTVTGVIELSRVIKYPTSKGQVAYKPEINYRYKVGAVHYTSNHVEYTMAGYELDEATTICNKFQRGQPAQIRYQEGNPQVSSLTTHIKWDVYLSLVAGVCWFLPATLILLSLPSAYQTPAGEFKPGYIDALKKRFNWRDKSTPNIWKPPTEL
jgi:hypothetical protein